MIKGTQLRDAFISGANSISNCRQQVDALNVFPVPDGDTGTNMSMTINAAKRELETLRDDPTVEQVAKKAASALLRGARGNSGVILSLLFRGFSKGLEGKQEADAKDIANALSMGVTAAYKAVMKPTEGTILTVARLAGEHAQQLAAQEEQLTAAQMWKEILVSAQDALAQTPEMLPVLKKAGVVDAGGQGFVEVWKGMLSVIEGGEIVASVEEQQAAPKEKKAHGVAAEFNEEDIHFCYCTEFIINKEDPNADPLALRAYLESIGDCVVVVDDEEIIKCHVHTNEPGNAIQAALKLGYLTNMKIDNMKEQHGDNNKLVDLEAEGKPAFPYKAVDPEKEYGFVAVAAGDGIKQLFTDLGVDNVVSGGQTMNPSTEDMLTAIEKVNAKNIFILPNNKNIILAANQAKAMTEDKNIIVVPTKTVPQGITAMISYVPEKSAEENEEAMTEGIQMVKTGQVTYAVRDTHIDEKEIHQGDIMGLGDHGLLAVGQDILTVAEETIRAMVDEDSELISIYYGEDMSEEDAESLGEKIEQAYPDCDVEVNYGGQPIYYCVVSVE